MNGPPHPALSPEAGERESKEPSSPEAGETVRRRTIPALVIAGVSSGVGKTTVTLGILESLRRRGLRVQAFKVGPDFIDPGFHELATGRPSYTLDGWMCEREHVTAAFARHAVDADLAVVEGVMGCFDGFAGDSDVGSTAQVAKWLGAPVVLVVNAAAMVRSAAAVVLGFEQFDPELNVVGVIFNRSGGPVHRQWLHDAVGLTCKARVLGALPYERALEMPERHLGLVTAREAGDLAERRRRLADAIDAHVDVAALIAMARSSVDAGSVPPPLGRQPQPPVATIGVARDEAFQFYYAENLEMLEHAGARLVFWSPLHDRELPKVDGLYIGGGYPELHGRALSDNAAIRGAVRRFAESGRPVYAECGGLMYLAQSLTDAEGASWPMVGVLPAAVTMERGALTLGYREVELVTEGVLGPQASRARGHEFHCSRLERVAPSVGRSYVVTDGRGGTPRAEGYTVGRTLMSYVHLHWGSNPALAANFVAACARGC